MVDDSYGDVADDYWITYRIWILYGSWAIYLHSVLAHFYTGVTAIIGLVVVIIAMELILIDSLKEDPNDIDGLD